MDAQEKHQDGPRTSIWLMTKPERENAATFLEFTTVKPFISHHGSFKCLYCTDIYPEVQSVLSHLSSHTTPPSRSSLLEQYVRQGMRVVKVDISDLKCRICELTFSNLDDIRNHLTTAHKKKFNAIGNGLTAYDLNMKNGLFACHKCPKQFNSFFVLNTHLNEHFNVVCEVCGVGFMSQTRLIRHRLTHITGTHKCDECEEIFATKQKLRYHTIKKHEISNVKKLKPVKCPQCLERFTQHHRKMAHLRKVHGIAFTFECAVCKTVFTSRRALTEHTNKMHTRKNECKLCGKCFGTNTLLKIHERGHSGVRNFSCDLCNKAFVQDRYLKIHMKTHVSGCKISCSQCGNGFKNKNEYNKHMAQWHPELTS